jgi:hypothetical protein
LNTNILAAASASHITAIANVYAGTATGADWTNMSSAAAAIYNNMQTTSFDTTLKSAISGISPSQLSVDDLDKTSIVESVQVYQPAFQLSDLNQLISLIPTDQSSLATALTTLKTNGLSPTVQLAAAKYGLIAAKVNAALNSSTLARYSTVPHYREDLKGRVTPAIYDPRKSAPHFQPAGWLRIARSLKNEDGGGGGYLGYNCQADTASIWAAGTVFFCIGMMAASGVLEFAAVATAISFWGGTGVSAWGLGHAVFCGF